MCVDARALGYTLEALARIEPRSRQLHNVQQMIRIAPRFTSCDRITGPDCFIGRLALVSVAELDKIRLPLHERAETQTSTVKSSLLRNLMPSRSPKTKPSENHPVLEGCR